MLGFLDVHLDISYPPSGHVAERSKECILPGLLIRWSTASEGSVADAVTNVLAVWHITRYISDCFAC
jgi:hypothetical protein